MKKLVVQFIEARDGGPMARFRDGLNTRVAFPDRSWRPLPRIGSTWEVEIAGLNPRRTVAFLRPVREIRDDVVAEPEPEVAPVSSRVLADETIDDLVRDALDRAEGEPFEDRTVWGTAPDGRGVCFVQTYHGGTCLRLVVVDGLW